MPTGIGDHGGPPYILVMNHEASYERGLWQPASSLIKEKKLMKVESSKGGL